MFRRLLLVRYRQMKIPGSRRCSLLELTGSMSSIKIVYQRCRTSLPYMPKFVVSLYYYTCCTSLSYFSHLHISLLLPEMEMNSTITPTRHDLKSNPICGPQKNTAVEIHTQHLRRGMKLKIVIYLTQIPISP